MKKLFITTIMVGILFSQPENAIFGTKLKGIKLEGFDPGIPVKFLRFYYYQSGEWYVLRARAKISGGYSEGDIIAIKLKGTQLEQMASDLPASEYFYGFSQSDPDIEGFVTLSAITTAGNSFPILRTKLKGSQVNSYSVSGQQIRRFYTSGPDANGWLWLCVDIDQPLGEHEAVPPREKGKEEIELKLTFKLEKVEPNPAKEFTRIYYSIAKPSYVKIYVYDKKGSLVKKIVDEYKPQGIYREFWGICDENNNLLPDGEYFIKFEAGKYKETKKILILK